VNRVVLDHAALQNLLRRPDVLQVFPFMAAAAAKLKGSKGCNGCGGKNRANLADYESLKAAIAQLGGDDKRKLRDLLQATEVRLVFKNFRNQTVRMTF
jgi:hypothetical protein